MGLKTNKATKTSTLNCQYVGSFCVKDEDKKMPISEQKKFVDAKLKNSTKKFLDGMPVFIQISPDGVQVLASDEKTVKMAHSLRRISYATVESTNKVFAYVSHQPGTDMEVVCHTFVTKKRDHAEGLSAALGKLFKETFAYTLKRRDKLEEAAQKRGAGRRWAKQQVAEGHSAVAKNARNSKPRSTEGNDVRKENDATPKSAPQQRPNQSTTPTAKNVDNRQRRVSPPGIPNTSASSESTTVAVHPPPSRQDQPLHNPPLPEKRETPIVTPSSGRPNSSQPNSPFDDSPFAPSWPTESQPPALPSRLPPSSTRSQSDNQDEAAPPELPRRAFPRQSSAPNSPENEFPPILPKRRTSDSSIGFEASRTSEVPSTGERRDSGLERKFSAPPDLMPATSPTYPPVGGPHNWSGENSFTHRPVSQDMAKAAAVLLSRADDIPPPLPRKGRQQPPPDIPEEIIGPDEDEELKQDQSDQPRVSLTLEDEDWYIPAVSREIVTELLETSDIGTFFVRDSQSRPGCYALTMKVVKNQNNPTGFGNYLIAPEGDGFALQGFDQTFPDISTLIRHYASYEDGLPCRLVLAGSNPLFHDDNGYLVEFMDDEDDRYASLASCTSMIREINMNDPW